MPEYDKETYAEQMKTRTKKLTDKLETGMKELYNSDKYKDYLNTMSRFHNYSSKNIMLIHKQMPNATKIASFKLWENKFKRHVKKGETGIYIYAPIAEKTPETKLMEKLDKETGAPLLDEKGKLVMEEMTALTNTPKFKLVPVFDVAQTYGDPLPMLTESLTGNIAHYDAFTDTLRTVSPLPIEFEPMSDSQDGYCNYGEKIGIREGMSETQSVSTIVHEITHSRLHDRESISMSIEPKPKNVQEIEAESISYVVCQYYGIDTSPNTFGYLAEYGSRNMMELQASLDTIRSEANSLITAIDEKFSIICKERGIDITAKVPDSEPSHTKENRTENIAGFDSEIQEAVPETKEQNSFRDNDKISFYTLNIDSNSVPSFYDNHTEAVEAYISAPPVDGRVLGFCGDRIDLYTFAQRESGIDRIMRDNFPLSVDDDRFTELMDSLRDIERRLGAAALEDFLSKSDRLQDEPFTTVFQTATEYEPPDIMMPDPTIGFSEMSLYGYTAEDMLPLTANRALELFDADHVIYMLYPENEAVMAFDREEIITFGIDGIFGVDRDEWLNSKEYASLSVQNNETVRESELIHGKTDTFAIYQLKNIDETRNYHFESFDTLEKMGFAVDRDNYTLAYTAPLPPTETLDGIYQQFNIDRPADFMGHSLSVSDIVVIQRDGEITSHYVDSFGFTELPAFLGVEKQHDSNITNDYIILDTGGSEQNMPKNEQPDIAKSEQPIYKFPAEIAMQNKELDDFQQSRQLNIECGRVIDQAVKDNKYEVFRYDFKTATETVTNEFGVDRTAWVLAGNINNSFNDARFSQSNRDWAKEFDTPKPDIYLDTHHTVLDGFIDSFRESAVAREQPEIPKNEIPVYKSTGETAYQNGEIDAYRQSYKLNVECGEAIDKAITDNNYELYRYDLKTAVKSVIEEYGTERASWVLASNINYHDWDGRLSDTNKAWAKDFDTPAPDVHLKTHLAILNGFTDRFREAEKEKPSLIDTLNKTEQKIKQQGKKPETVMDGKDKPKKTKREDIS